jgi:UDP-N-acetylmuramyl pentapeptide phosphotransferase/UDP-N-acetylglucosamine-1-phosphate transferase
MFENSTLIIALGASALVVWWIVKKLFKLALYAAIAGAIAWFWYFNIRG